MGKTKQPHLILIIPRLWLKLTLKSTLMRPLTTNLKTLAKHLVKTSRKPLKKAQGWASKFKTADEIPDALIPEDRKSVV